MGWIETPAPKEARCVRLTCDHARAVAVFVFRNRPANPVPMCEEHIVEILRRQQKLMEVREVRW